MKLGLIICAFNRPEYLRQCLESVAAADLTQVSTVLIVDDCSSDKETIRLLNDFELPGVELIKAFSKENRSIKGSLLFGCDLLFNSCDVVTNLDGDAIVRRDFVSVLLDLHRTFPEHIKTGFNCTTKNKDGSVRHKIIATGVGYNTKASVGGINMMFGKEVYESHIRTAIVHCLEHGGNWDHKACLISGSFGFSIICSVPSVVQHIGIESSMGHSTGGEPPDVADDFPMVWSPQGQYIPLSDLEMPLEEVKKKYFTPANQPEYTKYGAPKLQLLNVTLICADGFNVERCIHAANISCRDIEFGAVKILSYLPSDDPRVIRIRPLISSKDYSQFVLKEMVNYVDTEYMLIFQHDGFVLNAAAWTDEFLGYDMLGASWKFRPEKRTANGGFSLRSREMMKMIRDDEKIILKNDHIINNFAEDHVLFYIYREYLEEELNVIIAPEEICDKFSIEAWGVPPPGNKYAGSFGFHGFNVDFKDAALPYIPYQLPNRQIL